MEMLRLETLAHRARAYVVLHSPAQVGEVEVVAQPVHGALDALVTVIVDSREQLLQQRGCWRDIEACRRPPCHQ